MEALDYIMEGLPSEEREVVLKAISQLGNGVEDSPTVAVTVINKALFDAYSRKSAQLQDGYKGVKNLSEHMENLRDDLKQSAKSVQYEGRSLKESSENIERSSKQSLADMEKSFVVNMSTLTKELEAVQNLKTTNPANAWLLLIGFTLGILLGVFIAVFFNLSLPF